MVVLFSEGRKAKAEWKSIVSEEELLGRREGCGRNESTNELSSVVSPLPELCSSDLGGSSVLHEEVDGNASVSRDPVGTVGESTEKKGERLASTRQRSEGRTRTETHADALSTTPCLVIFPGTWLEVRSEGLTETSSRRM